MSKAKAFKGNANEGYIVAMRGKRSSNAAQPHDSRPRGQRDRKGAKAAAIRFAS